MNHQAMRFRLGLFVVAVLVLLAALIILFRWLPNVFRHMDAYTITFDNAAGIGPGTPVRRSGVRIGKVKGVQLVNETGKVRVHVVVDPQYNLRLGDQAVLVHGPLSTDSSIDFVARPGKPQPGDQNIVDPGAHFKGVNQANVNVQASQAPPVIPPGQETLVEARRAVQTLNRLAPLLEDAVREYRAVGRATREMIPEWQAVARATRAVIPELRDLVKESRKAVPALRRTAEEVQVAANNWGQLGERMSVVLQINHEKLEKAVDNLDKTLNTLASTFNEENRKNLNATLRNVKAGSDYLESITKSTDDLVKESRTTLHRVNQSVIRVDDVLGSLQEAVKPVPQRSQSTLKSLDDSARNLNLFLADLRQLTAGVRTADGSFRRFVVDPSLYNQLNDVACLLTRVVPRLDRVLRDAEVFADKIARHPESLGIGGVVRPSAGLKENPFAAAHGGTSAH
jgi:phospholipid/cholesterol/gamma-HCH transport system substrate-binding protein